MARNEPINLTRQLRFHLESLRAAGVLFVPRGEPLKFHALPLQQEAASVTIPVPAPMAAPEPPPDPSIERRRELTVLAAEIATCDKCPELSSTRTQTVFGVGPLNAEVAFVGEAPGADEDRQGEPFVGKAGQFLTRIINGCGFKREEVYIFNTLKCRPPGNRTPTPDECTNCRPFFEKQFDLVKPKFVVALGGTAAKSLLQTTTGISQLRGKIYEYRGVPLICTFHPSFVMRDESGALKRDVWEDMKMLLRLMGREIPKPKAG